MLQPLLRLASDPDDTCRCAQRHARCLLGQCFCVQLCGCMMRAQDSLSTPASFLNAAAVLQAHAREHGMDFDVFCQRSIFHSNVSCYGPQIEGARALTSGVQLAIHQSMVLRAAGQRRCWRCRA